MAAGASVGAILCEYFILKSSIYYFRFGYLSSTFPFFSSFFFLRFVVGAAAATIVGGCTIFFFCCFDSVGAIRRRIISPLRQPEHDATKHTFTNSAYKCKEEEAKKGKKKMEKNRCERYGYGRQKNEWQKPLLHEHTFCSKRKTIFLRRRRRRRRRRLANEEKLNHPIYIFGEFLAVIYERVF